MRDMDPQLHSFVWGLPLLIGVVAGSRAMTAPAAVSWAASFGWLALSATPLAWIAHPITHWVLTVFALGELVTDQLPSTPSRTGLPSNRSPRWGRPSGARSPP